MNLAIPSCLPRNGAPKNYAHGNLLDVVMNSLGQNFGCRLEEYRGAYDGELGVEVAVDYAVVIRPGARCAVALATATPTATTTPSWTGTPTPTETSGVAAIRKQ